MQMQQCDDGGDCFFESLDRVPSGISIAISEDTDTDDDDDDDVRISFSSAVAPPSFRLPTSDSDDDEDDDDALGSGYGVWMSEEPLSIVERRRLLFQGMGLSSFSSSNHLSRRHTSYSSAAAAAAAAPTTDVELQPPPVAAAAAAAAAAGGGGEPTSHSPPSHSPSPASAARIRRSRSHRRQPSPPLSSSLVRSISAPPALAAGRSGLLLRRRSPTHHDLFTIRNLDTGKEFVLSQAGKDGMLNDPQTGLQLTLDEFETLLGYSPIVKEVMRRVNLRDRETPSSSSSSTSPGSKLNIKASAATKALRKKGNWLKNIKVVANSVTGLITTTDRETTHNNNSSPGPAPKHPSSSQRMKVRQHGKSYKELTGLYMCQEIQAHQGSIWTIKFSTDSRYLATAGEDRVIHVWKVIEAPSSLATHHNAVASPSQSNKPSHNTGGKDPIPNYIVIPESIFSLSDTPFCSFQGHLDDVLDLSWSKSQNLLSSSMDKTVRLWDLDSKACLKLFAHNDYVTCIQFNPIDDSYFISGSLDAKVRLWSIPDRQVVDWSDLHEMVTAACYTPDGQGALVGSHKGSCRFYKTSDSKLYQEGQIDIQNKKRKSHAKKITGFQFAPDNSSEVMITAADSQIRVFDGLDMVQKYRGFRNTSSQMSASCTSDGKYVVCASEDSHVYIWKRDILCRSSGTGGKGKSWVTTRSHEHFHCRDVSIAIPWPSCGSNGGASILPSLYQRHREHEKKHLRCSDSFCSSHILEEEEKEEEEEAAEEKISHVKCSDSLQCDSSSYCSPLLPKKTCSDHPTIGSQEAGKPRVGSSSFTSASSSTRSGPLSSITASIASSSSLLSWGWHGGGSNRASSHCSFEDASAWGLVVVTGGLGGHIRVYQNFGFPLRLKPASQSLLSFR